MNSMNSKGSKERNCTSDFANPGSLVALKDPIQEVEGWAPVPATVLGPRGPGLLPTPSLAPP